MNTEASSTDATCGIVGAEEAVTLLGDGRVIGYLVQGDTYRPVMQVKQCCRLFLRLRLIRLSMLSWQTTGTSDVGLVAAKRTRSSAAHTYMCKRGIIFPTGTTSSK